MSAKHQRFNVTCDETLTHALTFLAKHQKKSISMIARELMVEALALREDYQLSKLAEESEKKSKGKPLYSHKDVWKDSK